MAGGNKGMPRAPKWSPEEDELLRKVWADPVPLKTALGQFSRPSVDSLVARAITLGLPDRRLTIPAERTKQLMWPRIKEALKSRRSTVAELAERAGCSECTVKRFIKANRAEMRIARFLPAFEAGNVTAIWAWGAGEDATRPAPLTEQEMKARYRKKLERERPEEIDRIRAKARIRTAGNSGRLVRRDPLVEALFGAAA